MTPNLIRSNHEKFTNNLKSNLNLKMIINKQKFRNGIIPKITKINKRR